MSTGALQPLGSPPTSPRLPKHSRPPRARGRPLLGAWAVPRACQVATTEAHLEEYGSCLVLKMCKDVFRSPVIVKGRDSSAQGEGLAGCAEWLGVRGSYWRPGEPVLGQVRQPSLGRGPCSWDPLLLITNKRHLFLMNSLFSASHWVPPPAF